MTAEFLVDRVPTWRAAFEVLERGGSILVHAPRHYGQERARRLACARHASLGFSACAVLRDADPEADAAARWQALARSLAAQLGKACPSDVGDARAFVEAMQAMLPPPPDRLLLVASTASGANGEPFWFDLVSAVVEALAEEPFDAPRFSLFATDDYSLYYYEALRTRGVSRWDILERFHHPPLEAHEIADLLQAMAPESPVWVASGLQELVGGHPGLVFAMSKAQLSPPATMDKRRWREAAQAWLASSGVLESVRRVLAEEPHNLCREALEYETPRPPRDHGNLALQLLRRHGVVQWTFGPRARLAQGMIASLVHELASLPAAPSNEAGASGAYPGAWELEDDDIVVLHLSDLHVGESFQFRHDFEEGAQPERACLAEMIAADVERLGLLGSIGAVIISGDFTDRGELGEFRRARAVITELLRRLGVDWSRVVIVAGNHDMQWSPGALDQARARSGASREAYATFRELVGRTGDPAAEVATVTSRSGRRAVQIVSLDSNFVEGPESGGIGYVAPEHLRNAQQLLQRADRSDGADCVTHRWLVLHHHVLPVTASPVEGAERRRVSVTANAADVLSFACANQVEMILHGHEHQPCITVEQRWPRDGDTWRTPVIVVGAGSVGASGPALGPFRRNQYFVVHHRDGAVRIRSRMMGDNGFSWVSHDDVDLRVPRRRPVERHG